MNTQKRYDWNEVQKLYDTGLSYKELHKSIGIAQATLNNAVKKGFFKSRTTSESSIYANKKYDRKILWTPELRKAQSEVKKKLYKEHPEKHPNRKLANNRQKMSYPEKLVFDWLTAQNIEFIHQRKIDKYYVDFNIGSLCIEVDGKYFHNKDSDKKRDKIITDLGFTIRRVSASNILKHGAHIVWDESIPDELLSKHIDLRKSKTCHICNSVYYGNRSICSDTCKQISTNNRTQVVKRKSGSIIVKVGNLPPVTKDDLQSLIDSNVPFTTIGKQYGVSDNAIRKWCKKYGINPSKQVPIDNEKLTELVNNGHGISYISKELKATDERIYKVIERLGLSITNHKPTNIDSVIVNQVKELIDLGKRNCEIIPIVGLDHQQVSAIRCKYKKALTTTT